MKRPFAIKYNVLTWIDVDDEWTIGGSITRVGNNLNTSSSSSGSGVTAYTSLKIYDGQIAKIRFTATSYVTGFNYTNTGWTNNENDPAYACMAENYSGGNGNIAALNYGTRTNLGNLGGAVQMEMEFTATECIWFYGPSRTEFKRMTRVVMGSGVPLYLVADAGGGGFQNIQQQGLIL